MISSTPHADKKSVRFIRGIGPKRFEALKRLGVQTIRDLCYFFPRRYEDRSHFQPIVSIVPGSDVTVRGEILGSGIRPAKHISIFELIVSDGASAITAVWFNQPYLKNQFQKGGRIILSGKAERYHDRLQLTSPEYELVQDEEENTIHTGRITPIYPLTEGLAQRSLRAAMKEVAERYAPMELKEFLPESIQKKYQLLNLKTAVCSMHFPEDFQALESARHRLIFDEFLLFELNLLSKIRTIQKKEQGIPFGKGTELLGEFKAALRFELTEEQEKTINEILESVCQNIPMNRLLQGEVGSGKTIVAAFFLFVAVRNKLQAALLVPTEILAEQHYQTLNPLFTSLGVSVALLTGSLENDEKRNIYTKLETGSVSIVIGTHALLQEEVQFRGLGLVVIDEQHRFGVRQRAQLVLRSPRPHLLVMTATPIPRTLGLTLYGDLDISTIRTLPKGRKAVKTTWMEQSKEKEVLEYVRSCALSKNEQAYILFPIIDETEKSDLQAATQEYERLRKGLLKDVSLGLVHGRLSKKERDEVMQRFYSNKIKVLVTTSIVEVGVDNPNVTSMIIEHSDRFGLSQLHQMRGRIGRGSKESICFLFGNPTTEEGKKRLEILAKTNDGFVIAEEDLKLRGPGTFFGTKQSGLPFFQIADLVRDSAILITARKEASRILDKDFNLSLSEHRPLMEELATRKDLFKSI